MHTPALDHARFPTQRSTQPCAHTRRGDGFEACAGTAGAENATWPHASIRRAPRSVANMLASGAQFGGLLVANCSVTVPGMEATVECLVEWRETLGTRFPLLGKPRRKGKGERKRACRSPPESGACCRSPCRRRPNATGSGRCLYAGSIRRSVFRARVLAGLPAPHAGTGSRQHGRGTTRTPPLTRTTGCAGLSVSDGDVRH